MVIAHHTGIILLLYKLRYKHLAYNHNQIPKKGGPYLPQRTAHEQPKKQPKKTIMVFVLGIILACLSLPLVIYAGERTTGRRIPRPQIFRSLSAPDPFTKQERESSPAPPARRQTMDSPRRADTTRSDTSWRTTSTGETYVREVSLGID